MYTYDDLCILLNKSRITPPGHYGPAPAMVRYAEIRDFMKPDRMNRIRELRQKLEAIKDIPYFPDLTSKIE